MGHLLDYVSARGLRYDPTVGFSLSNASITDMGTYQCEFSRGAVGDVYHIYVLVMRE